MMIDELFSSTFCFHQRNVSPLTTPPGFPPSGPRPTFWVGSFRSLIIRKSKLPTRNAYRSQVPSILCGRLSLFTSENCVCWPRGSIHFCHHHASGSSNPLR